MRRLKRTLVVLVGCVLAVGAGALVAAVASTGGETPQGGTPGAQRDATRASSASTSPSPTSATHAPAPARVSDPPARALGRRAPAGAGAAGRRRPDSRRVLVRFRSGTSSAEQAAFLRQTGATVEHRLAPEHIVVLRVPRGQTADAALARFRRDSRIALAEPNHAYSIQARPNDPFFPGNGASASNDLWGLNNSGQAGGLSDADIDAPEAYDRLGLAGATGAWPTADFAVGVVDTGIDANHEDLAGKAIQPCSSALSGAGTLVSGCTDDQGHGTHVAGTIAAVGNNGKGIVGVAPGAKVYACKALDSTGSGYDADIAACINDIVDHRTAYNIRVVSLSLGGTNTSTALAGAVDYAWNHGVLVVAAAGNDGNTSINYPAGYAHAVSVGATDRSDGHASFSNSNADVEVSAPGVSIVSTVPTYPTDPTDPTNGIWDPSGYMALDGTSMATPHAAAVAALIAQKNPGDTVQQVRDTLDGSVNDLGAAGRDPQFGFGRVNACLALGGSCTYRGQATSAPPPARATTPTSTAPAPTNSTPTSTTPSTPPTSTPPPAPVTRAYSPTRFTVLSGSPAWGSVRRLYANDSSRLEVPARRSGSAYTSDFYAATSVAPAARASLRGLTVDYDGNLSRAGSGLRLLVYDWSARKWSSIYLASRAPTSDRPVRWSTTRLPARFLSSSGEIRVRIRGSNRGSFRTRTDLVRFSVLY